MDDFFAAADILWPDVTADIPAELLTTIAAAAAAADRDGRPSTAGIAALKSAGWPGLAVPKEFSGGGAGLLKCCAAQRKLGMVDPGLAIAVNMHLFSVGLMVEHWRRRADTAWLLMEAIATQNRLLASAFAEPQLGGSVVRSTLRARRDGKGWRVSGTKAPCSLAADADLICLQMQSEPSLDGPDELLVAMLPTHAPGLTVRETWDTLGMRGSASNTILIEDCFVPDDLVFYRAPVETELDDVVAAGVVWFSLTSTAVYIGLAEAALRDARRLLDRMRIRHLDASRAELPSYQAVVGDATADLLAIESACGGLAARMDTGADPVELLPAALAVKQRGVEAIPAAVERLMEACGGAAYARATGLERLWRDSQAIRFHPPTRPAVRQFLGRTALDLPAGLDLDESAPALGKFERKNG
ncbi:acyl-CoA dehydrogenase family protein [Fodinicola acaciae]|uniref:acyl-CoA dehydrogenase family protein n=1 Tax=Fodinicola acaciae TaxID=2681555 RepID=UPI001FE8EFF8|nr:acyl-CoA dehydrogenase family protein [Fodinicola acaciae]